MSAEFVGAKIHESSVDRVIADQVTPFSEIARENVYCVYLVVRVTKRLISRTAPIL